MEKKKILLVEDVKYFVDVQKRLLKRTNCDLITISDGSQVLEIATKERPDLILLDIILPGMNGDDCCRAIKSDSSLKDVPIIMTILEGREDEKERCLNAGCDDYITKPINREELLNKVKKLLDLIVREHVRVPMKITASYSFQGEEFPCKIHDVSEGGMLIISNNPLTINSSILLKFVLPVSDVAILALGEVVRAIDNVSSFGTVPVKGYGIKFTKMPNAGRMIIAKAAGKI